LYDIGTLDLPSGYTTIISLFSCMDLSTSSSLFLQILSKWTTNELMSSQCFPQKGHWIFVVKLNKWYFNKSLLENLSSQQSGHATLSMKTLKQILKKNVSKIVSFQNYWRPPTDIIFYWLIKNSRTYCFDNRCRVKVRKCNLPTTPGTDANKSINFESKTSMSIQFDSCKILNSECTWIFKIYRLNALVTSEMLLNYWPLRSCCVSLPTSAQTNICTAIAMIVT